jgi:hypothetical protein
MKRLLLILTVISFSIPGLSQELNLPAQFLKEEQPETYKAVKTFAETKWEEDHNMILHEINGQAEAYIELIRLAEAEGPGIKDVIFNALKKWTEGEVGEFDNPTTDYKMVVHEVKKQMKAKTAY